MFKRLSLAAWLLVLTSGLAHAAGSQSDWSRFLDQATFGPTPAETDAWASLNPVPWIQAQATLAPTLYPSLPPYPSNAQTGCPGTGAVYTACITQNYSMYPLQVQFFQNALSAPDQLRQKVAFALSQILVVSGNKVRQPSSMGPYLNVLVHGALGNFRDLLQNVTLNPAMGHYLDMVNSDPASANGIVKPNENYAREVLQLFSLGLYLLNVDGSPVLDGSGQPIPAYTQDTIEGFARAFTGWTYATQPGASPQRHNPQNFQGTMEVYRNNGKDANHDHGAKQLLSYPGAVSASLPANQDAALDLSQALDNIFYHPNVGPFIGKQLIQHLVTSNPSPAYVARVTTVFNNNGRGVRGDLLATVQAILTDPEARGAPMDPVNFGKLREPALFLTAFLRAMNGATDGILNSKIQPMGQDLFNSPTVFNYYPHDYTVPGTSIQGPEFGIASTAAGILRANLINALVYSKINSSGSGTSISLSGLDLLGAKADATALLQYLNTYLLHGALTSDVATLVKKALVCTKSSAGHCSNGQARAQAALYLIATSSLYQVQR
ncbi:MAG: hypothetical protein RLZZ627_1440 [Pseudomonadota bacterium]|jgi:uncharacterized protein (DUF1800 family)